MNTKFKILLLALFLQQSFPLINQAYASSHDFSEDTTLNYTGGYSSSELPVYMDNRGNDDTINSGDFTLTLNITQGAHDDNSIAGVVTGGTTTFSGKELNINLNSSNEAVDEDYGDSVFGYEIWGDGNLNLNSKKTTIKVSDLTTTDQVVGIKIWNTSTLNVGTEEAPTESFFASSTAENAESIALDVLGFDNNVNIYTDNFTLSAENNTDDQGSIGLRVQGENTVNIEAENINIYATNSGGSNVYGIDIKATPDGAANVSLNGNTSIIVNNGNIPDDELHANAITVGGGVFNLNTNDTAINNNYSTKIIGDISLSGDRGEDGALTSTINFLSGDSYFNGNLDVADDVNSTLSFTDGALWTGYAVKTLAGDLTSKISLTNNSTWIIENHTENDNNHVQNISAITDLILDSSTVDLTSSNTDIQLETNTLTGNNGTFKLNANVQEDTANQVNITENATGNYTLDVANSGTTTGGVMEMETYLVRQENGDATFELKETVTGEHAVDMGVYNYVLNSRNPSTTATEWFLERDTLSPSGELVLGLSGMSSSYAIWMAQLSDLRERMGEIRYTNAPNGFWTRATAQENELSGFENLGLNQEMYTLSMGYDRMQFETEAVKLAVGFQAHMSDANQDVQGRYDGSGEVMSYGLTGYATLQHKNGIYFDLAGSWNSYQHDMKTKMLDGSPVFASYDSYGLGVSLETGYNIEFSNNAFFEPQAQLSYYNIGDVNYSLNNGMEVEQNSIDSLTGRLGFVLGKNFILENTSILQAYLKAGVNHEFLGDQTVYINEEVFTHSLESTRVYYGLGFDWKINESASLYGEFEREDGDDIAKPWGINLGLKINF